MTKKFDFTTGSIPQELTYCYAPASQRFDTFHFAGGGIENTFHEDDPSGGFMALLPDATFRTGSKLTAEMTFSGKGAPMLVFGYGVTEANGVKLFERRVEIVAHMLGCNVWDVNPSVPTRKLAYIEYPVADETPITLSAEIRQRDIRVTMNGHIFGFCRDALPETFVGGIMACEGPCRFTSMTIEE